MHGKFEKISLKKVCVLHTHSFFLKLLLYSLFLFIVLFLCQSSVNALIKVCRSFVIPLRCPCQKKSRAFFRAAVYARCTMPLPCDAACYKKIPTLSCPFIRVGETFCRTGTSSPQLFLHFLTYLPRYNDNTTARLTFTALVLCFLFDACFECVIIGCK